MNETIKSQLQHRTIRKFSDEKISDEIMDLLFDVAIRAASGTGLYSYSIIRIKDKDKKRAIADICGQPYAYTASELLIFVIDTHRNSKIAMENGELEEFGNDMDSFIQGLSDALISAQNMVVAAESLGIGTVYFGTILKDIKKMAELLKLPKLTFPIIGLGLGYPMHNPALKPRLPKKVQIFEDEYKVFDNYTKEIANFDEKMNEYIDLRDTSKTVGKFTKQVPNKLSNSRGRTRNIIEYIEYMGFKTKIVK